MQNLIIRAVEEHNFTVFDYKTEVKTNPSGMLHYIKSQNITNSVTLNVSTYGNFLQYCKVKATV